MTIGGRGIGHGALIHYEQKQVRIFWRGSFARIETDHRDRLALPCHELATCAGRFVQGGRKHIISAPTLGEERMYLSEIVRVEIHFWVRAQNDAHHSILETREVFVLPLQWKM